MGGARAVIASLGASISLVASAALSLLVGTLVFVYGDLVSGTNESASHAAVHLSVAPNSPAPRTRGSAEPVVIRATPASASRRTPAAARSRSASRGLRRVSGGSRTRRPAFTPGATDVRQATPAPAQTAAGDSVLEAGDAVSATVQGTGAATGAVTRPLGPPVSQAVQDVLDIVTALLKGATGALAGTVDALP